MPGFPQRLFVSLVPNDFICPICHEVLEVPVTSLQCSHTFCQGCIETWRRRRCPIQACRKYKIQCDFNHVLCEKIMKLFVECVFAKCGCPWVGKLEDIKSHVLCCEYCEISDTYRSLPSIIDTRHPCCLAEYVRSKEPGGGDQRVQPYSGGCEMYEDQTKRLKAVFGEHMQKLHTNLARYGDKVPVSSYKLAMALPTAHPHAAIRREIESMNTLEQVLEKYFSSIDWYNRKYILNMLKLLKRRTEINFSAEFEILHRYEDELKRFLHGRLYRLEGDNFCIIIDDEWSIPMRDVGDLYLLACVVLKDHYKENIRPNFCSAMNFLSTEHFHCRDTTLNGSNFGSSRSVSPIPFGHMYECLQP